MFSFDYTVIAFCFPHTFTRVKLVSYETIRSKWGGGTETPSCFRGYLGGRMTVTWHLGMIEGGKEKWWTTDRVEHRDSTKELKELVSQKTCGCCSSSSFIWSSMLSSSLSASSRGSFFVAWPLQILCPSSGFCGSGSQWNAVQHSQRLTSSAQGQKDKQSFALALIDNSDSLVSLKRAIF